jgi:tRNA A-37 threonylcarbamoyl transferase component Bud32
VILAPILNQRQGVQAFLLVYDHHFLQKFRDVLSSLQLGETGDVYAFSTGGWNLSQPRHVASLVEHGWISPDEEASSWFRLVDPGVDLSRSVPVRSRAALPLTESVAAASAGLNGHNDIGYRNYAGVQVLGAWRWIPSLQMGVAVERAHREIFASLASIRQAYYFLLVSLIFAGGLAWFWARRRLRVGFDSPNTVGPYELVVPLASGGMGTVYRARHSLLKRPAAVKVIRADRLSEDDVLRFDREVRIASKLSSPHTISIFDYGQSDGGQWYFAMELLDGMTLDKVVQRYGPLPAHRVVHIARQICESLHEAHQLGMIHRDIKPQNIMLTQRGLSPDFAVVFDFGLAKPIQPEASLFMTSERMWVGTPMYMSPERIRDPKSTDSRSDVYAVGVLMYFLLVGDEPFSAADPSALFEQIMTVVPPPPSREAKFPVPQSLDDLIADCLAKSLEQRPAHVAQLRSSLDAIANEIPWNREEAANWWNSAMSH